MNSRAARRPAPVPGAVAALLALGLVWPAASGARDTAAAGPDTVVVDTAEAGGTFYGRSYAIVAYDTARGHLGLAAASTEFSVASGGAHVERGLGAVVAQGRGGDGVGRRLLEALRSGLSPAAALGAIAPTKRPVQAAALTPGCARASARAPWASAEAASRPGRTGDTCYVALGFRLRRPSEMDRLVESFRSSTGTLRERLLAAVSAMESYSRSVGGSRSAVLWVTAEDSSHTVMGRRELRLQVEDHERPALALEKQLETGRADWLARRAGRAVDRGAHRRAASLADSSLTLDVSAPTAWLHRGRALLHLGREEEAETAFRRMLELDPFMLRLLGDASDGEITVHEAVIPYYPRVVLRLDLYRRRYFDDLDFGPEPRPFAADSTN